MNVVAIASRSPAASDLRSELEQSLSLAHAGIEARFSEGARALVAIMDVLKQLMQSMDQLTNSLDGDTAADTMAKIQAAKSRLSILPDAEADRGRRFDRLRSACADLSLEIATMREIMRYLRMFAVTARITGAQLHSFASFADEIGARILHGATSVDEFATQLETMRRDLGDAAFLSGEVAREYSQGLPAILEALTANASAIESEHAAMAALASEARQVAASVQGKIAAVLSNLQTGDITRQRIEHILSAFRLLDEYTQEAPDLSPAVASTMRARVEALAAAQMVDMQQSFSQGCADVMAGISGFTGDASSLLAIRDHMLTESGSANPLQALQSDIADAGRLVSRLVATSDQADAVAAKTAGTVQSLLQGIGLIRQIEVEIHYMALNSTLRCSKLGEAGLPVNVISAELRQCASLLEEPAQASVAILGLLEDLARAFDADRSQGVPVTVPLEEVAQAIAGVCDEVDRHMASFSSAGQDVFHTIGTAVQALDFDKELGDALRRCTDIAGEQASFGSAFAHDLSPAEQALGQSIFRLYTMAEERTVHARFFPPMVSSLAEDAKDREPSAAEADATEDDLDALLF